MHLQLLSETKTHHYTPYPEKIIKTLSSAHCVVNFLESHSLANAVLDILRCQFYLLNLLFVYLCGEKRAFLSSGPQRTFHERLGKLTASMTWLRKREHGHSGRDEVSLFCCFLHRYP